MLSFSLIFETYLHPLHIYILFNNYLSVYYLHYPSILHQHLFSQHQIYDVIKIEVVIFL